MKGFKDTNESELHVFTALAKLYLHRARVQLNDVVHKEYKSATDVYKVVLDNKLMPIIVI